MSAKTVQGWKLFKGGNYLWKYGSHFSIWQNPKTPIGRAADHPYFDIHRPISYPNAPLCSTLVNKARANPIDAMAATYVTLHA